MVSSGLTQTCLPVPPGKTSAGAIVLLKRQFYSSLGGHGGQSRLHHGAPHTSRGSLTRLEAPLGQVGKGGLSELMPGPVASPVLVQAA